MVDITSTDNSMKVLALPALALGLFLAMAACNDESKRTRKVFTVTTPEYVYEVLGYEVVSPGTATAIGGDGLVAGGDAVAMSNLTTNRPTVYRIVFTDPWGSKTGEILTETYSISSTWRTGHLTPKRKNDEKAATD